MTRDWAEPGSKMLSVGNYDNRPTRVWAELGSKLVNDWSVKYVTKLVKKIKLNTTRILLIFFTRFVTLTSMVNFPLLRSYSQKHPNPHLQFTNILFNV